MLNKVLNVQGGDATEAHSSNADGFINKTTLIISCILISL